MPKLPKLSNVEKMKALVSENLYGGALYPEVGHAVNEFSNQYLNPVSQVVQSFFEPVNRETGAFDLPDLAGSLPVAPMIRDLVNRIKIGDKSAEAAIKTIKKFAFEKVENNPYWGKTELIPTRIAKQLREINRNLIPKYAGHRKSVEDYILEHGINDSGIVSYSPERIKAHLSEGNTRTTAAENLNIPFVPLRGFRSNRLPWNKINEISIPEINPFGGERVPETFRPSELGFDVYDTDELIDLYLKLRK